MTRQQFKQWAAEFLQKQNYKRNDMLPQSARGEPITIGEAFDNLSKDDFYLNEWEEIAEDINEIDRVGNDPLDYVGYIQPTTSDRVSIEPDEQTTSIA